MLKSTVMEDGSKQFLTYVLYHTVMLTIKILLWYSKDISSIAKVYKKSQ